MKTVTIKIKIDSELNEQATAILKRLELPIEQAISVFLHQVVLHRGLPFEVKYPQ